MEKLRKATDESKNQAKLDEIRGEDCGRRIFKFKNEEMKRFIPMAVKYMDVEDLLVEVGVLKKREERRDEVAHSGFPRGHPIGPLALDPRISITM